MLSKIKEFLNKQDDNSITILKIGIVSDNNLLPNFNELEVVEDIFNEKTDICFVDSNSDNLEKIKENVDILVSLGSINNIDADLVIPGREVSDESLEVVVKAFVEDDIDYLKPLFVMTQNNDFKTKTVAITVSNDLCTGCGGCAYVCPEEVIKIQNTRPVIDFKNCIHCGSCFMICPKSWNLHEEVEQWC